MKRFLPTPTQSFTFLPQDPTQFPAAWIFVEIAHVQFLIQLAMCFNTALNLVFKLNNIL